MKKISKILFVLFTTLCLYCTTVSAEGNVTYDGDAGDFVFFPGSVFDDTDLFSDFKDVMPGDTITQDVIIKNPEKIGKPKIDVDIYMRSLGAGDEVYVDFLSKLNITVKVKDGDVDLFSVPADQETPIDDWYYLGEIKSGGEVTLEVTLEVPVELDNDYADAIGEVVWQFMVEEHPVNTGDNSNILLYAVGSLLSLLLIILLFVLLKNRKNKEKYYA